MRLLICAGGTGGGVYPALTILRALGADASQVLWVGGMGGMEASLVQRVGVPFQAIPAAGVHGVSPARLPSNLWALARGVFASRRILRQFQPDVLLFTGGYVAVPMALAAGRIPSLLYVPDIEPGLALKTLARRAACIALTAEESRIYFPKSACLKVTGYPTRQELGKWKRPTARALLELNGRLPVLLVSGGSRGAHSINHTIWCCLPELLQICEVVHITGERDWDMLQAARNNLNPDQARLYHVYPYLHEDMGAALSAADLVISRAGASTLGEYPLFGLPAILVPYPHAWRYQKVNADYLVNKDAAVMLEDDKLEETLLDTVSGLLNSPQRLEAMGQAMRALAKPQAPTLLADMVRQLAGQPGTQTGGRE